jgi:hypothetical protein
VIEIAARVLSPVRGTEVRLMWVEVLRYQERLVDDPIDGPEILRLPVYGRVLAETTRPKTEFLARSGVESLTAYVERHLPRPD